MSIGRYDIRRLYNQKEETIFLSSYSYAYKVRGNIVLKTDLCQFDDKHKAVMILAKHSRAGMFR